MIPTAIPITVTVTSIIMMTMRIRFGQLDFQTGRGDIEHHELQFRVLFVSRDGRLDLFLDMGSWMDRLGDDQLYYSSLVSIIPSYCVVHLISTKIKVKVKLKDY